MRQTRRQRIANTIVDLILIFVVVVLVNAAWDYLGWAS